MKTKTSRVLELMAIGLILIGVSFFGIAKAEDMPVIMEQPPADLPLPDGVKLPEGQDYKSIISSPNQNEIPDGAKEPVAFKQIDLLLSDLKTDKFEYFSGDTIKGSFKIKNNSNYYSNGLYYKVTLHRINSDKENVMFFDQSTYIDYSLSETFNFSPQEEKNFSFSQKIPKFSQSGAGYLIRVTTFNARGLELASNYQKLIIKNNTGDERMIFLDPEKSQIFAPNRPYGNQEGGVFEYGKEYNPAMEKDKPNTIITLKNEVQTRIGYLVKNNPKEKVKAKVSFYKHGNYTKVIDSKEYEVSNDFSNGSSGYFDLTLPLFPEPGTYEAVVKLFVGENEASNFLGIRYTTKGDSGLIYDFLVEEKGDDNFTLNLFLAGPADLNIREDKKFEGKVFFEVREEETKKTCFGKTIFTGEGAMTQVHFTLDNCSKPYQFNATLYNKDGKILDQQEISQSAQNNFGNNQENQKSIRNIIFISFGILTVILLFVIFFRKKPTKPIFVIIFTLSVSFGLFGLGNKTKAGEFNSSPYGGPYHYLSAKVPNAYTRQYVPVTCPSGYSQAQSAYGDDNYYYSYQQPICCPSNLPYYKTDWWGGYACYDYYSLWGWSWNTAPATIGSGGYWTWVPVGYFYGFDYYLQNYKSSFNQGETMSIYEVIHNFTNCGNSGSAYGGYSNYYVYNAYGQLVFQSGYWHGEYAGAASMSIPLNFAPGNYVLYISSYKQHWAGQDDPMYTGSDWIWFSFNIINPNATLSVGYPGNNGIVYDGVGIYCGGGYGYCSTSIPFNNWRNLYAASLNGATFSYWTGDCAGAGSNPTCSLYMNSSKSVSAVFSCSCNSSDTANHCEGTTYTNSCGATCTGTKPNNPWTPDPSGTCNNSTLTQTSNCGNTRTVPGTMPTLNGQCGSASGKLWDIKPNSDLCSIGTSSDPTSSENQWCWNCSGICGGSATECCAQRDSNWKEVAP